MCVLQACCTCLTYNRACFQHTVQQARHAVLLKVCLHCLLCGAADQRVKCCMLKVQAIHPLTRYRLQRIISTREEDLVGMHRMGSISALENYAEGTASQLLYLQVKCQLSSCLKIASAQSSTLGWHCECCHYVYTCQYVCTPSLCLYSSCTASKSSRQQCCGPCIAISTCTG